MVGWLSGWVVEWLSGWVVGWVGGWVVEWLGGWVGGCCCSCVSIATQTRNVVNQQISLFRQ